MTTRSTEPKGTTGGQRRRTARSVVLVDRAARGGITAGGVGIIVAILGILVFILLEAVPLFAPGRVELEATYTLADSSIEGAARPSIIEAGLARRFRWHPPVALGVDEYRELAWRMGAAPCVEVFDPRDGHLRQTQIVDSLRGARISAVAPERGGGVVVGTEDGRLLLAEASFEAVWEGDHRSSRFGWREDAVVHLASSAPILHVAGRRTDESITVACVQAGADLGSTLSLIRQSVRRSLLGDVTRTTRIDPVLTDEPEDFTALEVRTGELFAGTSEGKVFRFRCGDEDAPTLLDVLEVEPGRAVTAMTSLLGDVTLAIGTESGGVTTWFGVREADLGNRVRPFRRIHEFPPLATEVRDLSASPRNKSFTALDLAGNLRIFHQTTGRTLAALRLEAGGGVDVSESARCAVFGPKGDGLLTADAGGVVQSRSIRIPHPEISLRALFGRVWYEGYTEPDYVWQSTGGSDDFESKLSLVPLVFGTLKGTIYALLFAVPIALMAAIYTSQFMAERVRQFVKPTVEVMAALPSVVLGFLAGLFLAPHLEQMVPATFVFLVLLPIVPALIGVLWQTMPSRVRGSMPLGFELVALVPIVVGTVILAKAIGPWVEQLIFPGGFRPWLLESAGTRYDQRNCIVVGFAMGFAVIPIIFTIVEDSLTAVPRSLIAGSVACGASRWQTAVRIILPAAGSGIFSAIMIGFGRAVGETMIVLMATGNTPIMDWSVFNGMRTLSANIAVEMPEAPYRGTLYRLLFLAGLLLLLLTSIVNTAAELIRLRLKRKFGNY